jgi:hypothetical protein
VLNRPFRRFSARAVRAEIERLVTWPPPDDGSGNGYARIDPAGELLRLSDLPVAAKYAQPGFLTAERFLAAAPRTLYHARGFLDHSVGNQPRASLPLRADFSLNVRERTYDGSCFLARFDRNEICAGLAQIAGQL